MPGNVNNQTIVAVILSRLRRHFGSCRECRGAIKSGAYDSLCEYAKKELILVATKWEANISKRLTMAHDKSGYIFPCPDLSAHGPAYSVAAEPMIVVAMQDRLL